MQHSVTEALNMQLETVRTVLKNDVNEISVCVDLKRRTGVFYTVISITGPAVRKQIAGMLAAEGLFASNNDYIGFFPRGESLNLVFLYRNENNLARQEAIYATSFARRKQIAENLLAALAETQAAGAVGMLFLNDRNVNIAPDLTIYYNYFLDFKAFNPACEPRRFYQAAAEAAFKILAGEYELRHDGQVSEYPSELQVFYKKVEMNSFASYSGILSFIKMLPDQPTEPNVGFRRVISSAQGLIGWVRSHSMKLFIAALISATLIYLGYQIIVRISYNNLSKQNTTYVGLADIGEVYLGDETI